MRRFNTPWLMMPLLLAGLAITSRAPSPLTLPADVYVDRVRGAWQATMVANHTGLAHEGKYLDEPSSAEAIELVLLDQWRTDDDTAVEWVDLHITGPEIAARTQALAEAVVRQAGGWIKADVYVIPGD